VLRVVLYTAYWEERMGKKNRKGKREYLSDAKTGEMLKHLNPYLEGMVDVPRI
jgi:hypothetical protein